MLRPDERSWLAAQTPAMQEAIADDARALAAMSGGSEDEALRDIIAVLRAHEEGGAAHDQRAATTG